jgi:hypothetical protein
VGHGAWALGAGALGVAADRSRAPWCARVGERAWERREEEGEREEGEREKCREAAAVVAGSQQGACAVGHLDGPLVGELRLGFFLFFFFFRNAFLKSSKIPKNSPKLFINKILDFRLITIILFNYYINY